jgi:hypothetical protein
MSLSLSCSIIIQVDMWSVGCIIAELLDMLDTLQIPASDRRALFPGRSCFPLSNSPKEKSSQKDQVTTKTIHIYIDEHLYRIWMHVLEY